MFDPFGKRRKQQEDERRGAAVMGGGAGYLSGDLAAIRHHERTAPIMAIPVDDARREIVQKFNRIADQLPGIARLEDPAFKFEKAALSGGKRMRWGAAGALGGGALAFILKKMMQEGENQ